MSREISYEVERIIRSFRIDEKKYVKKDDESWDSYDLRMESYAYCIKMISNFNNVSDEVIVHLFSLLAIKNINKIKEEMNFLFDSIELEFLSNVYDSIHIKSNDDNHLKVLKILCASFALNNNNEGTITLLVKYFTSKQPYRTINFFCNKPSISLLYFIYHW